MGIFPAQSLDDCGMKKVVQKFGRAVKNADQGVSGGLGGLIFLGKQRSGFFNFLKQGNRFGPIIFLSA
jgi:hypothetical protein